MDGIKTELKNIYAYNEYASAFVCKVAKDVDNAKELIELGFDYVNDITGLHLSKKKK